MKFPWALVISQAGLYKERSTGQDGIVDVHAEIEESEHEKEGTHVPEIILNWVWVCIGGELVADIVVEGCHEDRDDD